MNPPCRQSYSPVYFGMPAYDDELFGPVPAVITIPDEAEAIRVADDSIFGPTVAVFATDLVKSKRTSRLRSWKRVAGL